MFYFNKNNNLHRRKMVNPLSHTDNQNHRPSPVTFEKGASTISRILQLNRRVDYRSMSDTCCS